jgi:hypothetical protein
LEEALDLSSDRLLMNMSWLSFTRFIVSRTDLQLILMIYSTDKGFYVHAMRQIRGWRYSFIQLWQVDGGECSASGSDSFTPRQGVFGTHSLGS